MSNPTPPMPESPRPQEALPPIKRLLVTAVVLAVFTGAMWLAWLGWDHTYYEVDGVAQGPYRAWQVVGCALSIAIATVLAYRRAPRALAIAVMTLAAVVGFAVPWSVDASAGDETGLWAVGLFLLVIGGGIALSLLLLVTHLLSKPGISPTPALVVCAVLTLLTLLVYPPAAVAPLLGAGWVFFFRWLPARRRAENGMAR